MTHYRQAVLRTLAGAMMISFSAPLARVADTAPTVSGFYRMLFGGLMLLLLGLLRRRRLRAGPGTLSLALVVGFFFAWDLIFWHRSIDFVGPGLATILANFQVFVLAAVGIFVYRERFLPRYALGLPLAVLGLWLLVGVDWDRLPENYHFGVWMGLATAAAYSAYTLTLRRTQGRPDASDPGTTLMLVSLLCAAVLAVSVLLEGESFAIPNGRTWATLLTYGLVAQVLGWVLIARSLPHLNASIAGLMLLLQPALSFTWDIVLFHRPTTWVEILGAALALAGIYLGTTGRARPATITTETGGPSSGPIGERVRRATPDA